MSNKNLLTLSPSPLFRTLGNFLYSRPLAPSTVSNYQTMAGAFCRYLIAMHQTDIIGPGEITAADLEGFVEFYRCEPIASGASLQRSHNTICSTMRCMRTFFNWCQRHDIISSNPFANFDRQLTERYPSPYFLTTSERDMIARADLSVDSRLAVQRDIFIFQCLTGCRVSDLQGLTAENISGDTLEYIARKTASTYPAVVRVPLHPSALAIISRYRSTDSMIGRSPLLPFISAQRYNYAIKEILTLCSITRQVSLLCPYSGKPVRKPINQVASSHLARRTFIGNLYRKVKDPSLISSLTGHCEGSKAFARYRTIDDEIKRELIMLL